jgi:hypothetical protein
MEITRTLSSAVPAKVTSRNGSVASEKRVMRGLAQPKKNMAISIKERIVGAIFMATSNEFFTTASNHYPFQ